MDVEGHSVSIVAAARLSAQPFDRRTADAPTTKKETQNAA